MDKVYVIHENEAWVEPLRAAFAAIEAPFAEWFLDRGAIDLRTAPPPGVFFNRMSASSHTRGHIYSPEYAGAVIEWLEAHDALLINGRRALQLELSKVAQYQALRRAGIPVPETIAVVGRKHIGPAARELGFPVILKHNRAGKGLGVQLVLSEQGLSEVLDRLAANTDPHAEPRDGIWLVQRYIQAPEPFITRAEFVGGKFLYAVRVDTSEGFELCPADACQLPDGAACPASPSMASTAILPAAKFRIVPGFTHELLPRMEAFLAANDVGVAAIEFITDAAGDSYAYDVNTNTNYNPEAERLAGVSGMASIAGLLAGMLERRAPRRAA